MCYIVYSKVLLAPLICQAVTGVPHFRVRYFGFYIADLSSPKTCLVGNTTYHEGEDWHEDACTRCQCSIGQKVCTQQVCSTSCVNPVKKPGVCCSICSGRIFFLNSWWHIQFPSLMRQKYSLYSRDVIAFVISITVYTVRVNRIQYLCDQRVARYNFPYVKMLSVTCIVVYSATL